jgi:hypothetical protein
VRLPKKVGYVRSQTASRSRNGSNHVRRREGLSAYRFPSSALRWISSQGGEAFDDPEHGDGADGVGRDEFRPARKWNADAAREDDQEHHHANEQEISSAYCSGDSGAIFPKVTPKDRGRKPLSGKKPGAKRLR